MTAPQETAARDAAYNAFSLAYATWAANPSDSNSTALDAAEDAYFAAHYAALRAARAARDKK